jgi:prepilin-type N-terminal cleavage/methylation domain-containing protein/prepilin-type processing-associated H-X9-DG protein
MAASRNQQSALPDRAAFTLIELLVVIAIIGLLLAILTPTLLSAKKHARLAICAARQRDFVDTMVAYQAANAGEWLASGGPLGGDGKPMIRAQMHPFLSWSFHFKLSKYLIDGNPYDGKVWISGYYGDASIFLRGPNDTRDGALLETVATVAQTDIFWCPLAPTPDDVKGTSIAPNAAFAPITNHWQRIRKAKQLPVAPSTALMCGDGAELGIRTWNVYRDHYTYDWEGRDRVINYCGEYADPMFRHFSSYKTPELVDQASTAVPYGPGFPEGPGTGDQNRGDGKANIGFLDGHVEAYDEPTLERDWNSGHIFPYMGHN